jgi:hypothetical protein
MISFLRRSPQQFNSAKPRPMKPHIVISLISAGLIASVLPLRAQHPAGGEHPTNATDKPAGAPNADANATGKSTSAPKPQKQASTADISAGIKSNIAATSKKSPDGKFHFKHEGKDLALTLSKVHDDRLSSVGTGKYFACVDMKGADGNTYDLDFFLTGDPGAMKVVETTVHKVNGKPLYNWEEKNGVWRKSPAKA